ncbi:Outer membrane protein X [Bienertia sinuspersici]
MKYEKLPLFCFICGNLGHGKKECDAHRGDFSPKKHYGAWLRASPWRRVKDWQKEEGPPGSTAIHNKTSEGVKCCCRQSQ